MTSLKLAIWLIWAGFCCFVALAFAMADDGEVSRIRKSTITHYGYADAPTRTGIVTRAEVWTLKANGNELEISLPPNASDIAKRNTALAELRRWLGNDNATLRYLP